MLFGELALPPAGSYRVALSGGLDSTVLLHALATLHAGHGHSFGLQALHIEHGLHPDSSRWAAHCRAQCARLGLTCTVESVRVDGTAGGGPEAAARTARYAAFARRLAPGEVLLTAHHRDDQAETLLLQLFRGAGVHGLAGMAPVSRFSVGRLARPLLGFTRRQLAGYAADHGLHWIEDPSNANLDLRRNFVRHRLLPAIHAPWPQASAALARTAVAAAGAAALVDDTARLDLASCRLPGPLPGLSAPALRSLPPGRLENALRLWLRTAGFRSPDSDHIQSLARRIRGAPHTGQEQLPCPGVEIRRHRDALCLSGPATPPARLDRSWNPAEPIELADLGLRLSTEATVGEGLACARIAGRRIRLRLRRGGERCRLPGRRHHHQLKKLLQARGVAPWLRTRLPLVYVDDELAAVADLWTCQPFAAAAGEPGWRLILQPI